MVGAAGVAPAVAGVTRGRAAAAGAGASSIGERHVNNVAFGRDLIRRPAPVQELPTAPPIAAVLPSHWAPVRGLPLSRRVSSSFTGMVVPPPVRVRTATGERVTQPTAPVSRPAVVTSQTAARLSILAEVPRESALTRERNVFLLEWFLRAEGRTLQQLCPDIVADFIVWRVQPTVNAPRPPAGFHRVVTIATALNGVWAARAHWKAVESPLADAVRGGPVCAIATRLGARVRPESVRKTAIPVARVMALLHSITLPCDWELARDVFLIVLGIIFATRPGELALLRTDLRIVAASFTFVWRAEKPRGGRAAAPRLTEPRTRTCSLSILQTAWDLYSRYAPASGPLFPQHQFSTTAVTTASIRVILRHRFGLPPVDVATGKRLPWSLRATCATWLWYAGMPPERIR